MEVRLVRSEGLPEGCLLSVRAGSTRRQQPADPNRLKLRFDEWSNDPLRVDLLAPIGGTGVEVQPDVESYEVTVPSPDIMAPSRHVTLQVRRTGQAVAAEESKVGSGQAASQPLKRDSAARAYLQKHNVMPWVQGLLQELVTLTPDDPWAFIEKHLTATAPRKTPEEPEAPFDAEAARREMALVLGAAAQSGRLATAFGQLEPDPEETPQAGQSPGGHSEPSPDLSTLKRQITDAILQKDAALPPQQLEDAPGLLEDAPAVPEDTEELEDAEELRVEALRVIKQYSLTKSLPIPDELPLAPEDEARNELCLADCPQSRDELRAKAREALAIALFSEDSRPPSARCAGAGATEVLEANAEVLEAKAETWEALQRAQCRRVSEEASADEVAAAKAKARDSLCRILAGYDDDAEPGEGCQPSGELVGRALAALQAHLCQHGGEAEEPARPGTAGAEAAAYLDLPPEEEFDAECAVQTSLAILDAALREMAVEAVDNEDGRTITPETWDPSRPASQQAGTVEPGLRARARARLEHAATKSPEALRARMRNALEGSAQEQLATQGDMDSIRNRAFALLGVGVTNGTLAEALGTNAIEREMDELRAKAHAALRKGALSGKLSAVLPSRALRGKDDGLGSSDSDGEVEGLRARAYAALQKGARGGRLADALPKKAVDGSPAGASNKESLKAHAFATLGKGARTGALVEALSTKAGSLEAVTAPGGLRERARRASFEKLFGGPIGGKQLQPEAPPAPPAARDISTAEAEELRQKVSSSLLTAVRKGELAEAFKSVKAEMEDGLEDVSKAEAAAGGPSAEEALRRAAHEPPSSAELRPAAPFAYLPSAGTWLAPRPLPLKEVVESLPPAPRLARAAAPATETELFAYLPSAGTWLAPRPLPPAQEVDATVSDEDRRRMRDALCEAAQSGRLHAVLRNAACEEPGLLLRDALDTYAAAREVEAENEKLRREGADMEAELLQLLQSPAEEGDGERAAEPDGPPSVSQLREMAGSLLSSAVETGELQGALELGLSPEHRVKQLKERIGNRLSSALKTGELQRALKQRGTVEAEARRQLYRDAGMDLLAAAGSGHLVGALEELKKSGLSGQAAVCGPVAEGALRQSALDALRAAEESGELARALGGIGELPKEEAAATKIQAVHRGKVSRARTKIRVQEEGCARKIQAAARARAARARTKALWLETCEDTAKRLRASARLTGASLSGRLYRELATVHKGRSALAQAADDGSLREALRAAADARKPRTQLQPPELPVVATRSAPVNEEPVPRKVPRAMSSLMDSHKAEGPDRPPNRMSRRESAPAAVVGSSVEGVEDERSFIKSTLTETHKEDREDNSRVEQAAPRMEQIRLRLRSSFGDAAQSGFLLSALGVEEKKDSSDSPNARAWAKGLLCNGCLDGSLDDVIEQVASGGPSGPQSSRGGFSDISANLQAPGVQERPSTVPFALLPSAGTWLALRPPPLKDAAVASLAAAAPAPDEEEIRLKARMALDVALDASGHSAPPTPGSASSSSTADSREIEAAMAKGRDALRRSLAGPADSDEEETGPCSVHDATPREVEKAMTKAREALRKSLALVGSSDSSSSGSSSPSSSEGGQPSADASPGEVMAAKAKARDSLLRILADADDAESGEPARPSTELVGRAQKALAASLTQPGSETEALPQSREEPRQAWATATREDFAASDRRAPTPTRTPPRQHRKKQPEASLDSTLPSLRAASSAVPTPQNTLPPLRSASSAAPSPETTLPAVRSSSSLDPSPETTLRRPTSGKNSKMAWLPEISDSRKPARTASDLQDSLPCGSLRTTGSSRMKAGLSGSLSLPQLEELVRARNEQVRAHNEEMRKSNTRMKKLREGARSAQGKTETRESSLAREEAIRKELRRLSDLDQRHRPRPP